MPSTLPEPTFGSSTAGPPSRCSYRASPERADGLDFVDVAVEVQRTSGHVTTTGFSTSGTLLAVRSRDFAKVGWYRPDFAGGLTLEELTGLLTPTPPPGEEEGILLPADATGISVYVQPGRPDNRMTLRARLQDDRGYYFDATVSVSLTSGSGGSLTLTLALCSGADPTPGRPSGSANPALPTGCWRSTSPAVAGLLSPGLCSSAV